MDQSYYKSLFVIIEIFHEVMKSNKPTKNIVRSYDGSVMLSVCYEGRVSTYLSYLKQLSEYGEIYPPEKNIYTFDDIPCMSLNFRCDNPFWYLEYYSLFNVYFMENPFITDTTIYTDN